ncbi:hypothetical protein C7447_103194 [Tenacibaculum adriaticum]|uniref:Lipoprotein n=1 Tax=Tenacibaculum adriaticum TaxID=413713 RepID=A0A5S5DSP2_9FLAO|nr:hypothetical protein [Tenacibaculum adriaticum]TYP98026.1 hypothetical protein C7447_103194 [Tenacibaculum adriaticum]
MKKIKNLLYILTAVTLLYSCDSEENGTVGTIGHGAIVTIADSSEGKLLGSAVDSDDLENSQVIFSDTELNLTVDLATGGDNVSNYEVVKTYNGGSEVVVASSATLPINISYTTLADYIDDLGLEEANLRIGDVITFKTKMTTPDGVFYAASTEGTFNVTINCSADLTGTYLVTNSSCNPSFTTTISKNADGTWHIGSGDGGWLHQCTGNTSLLNSANITVVCGKIQPTGDLDYGSNGGSYDIGDIQGGTWDQATGVLTMEHTQTWSASRDGSWTSTYTRQ